MENHVDFEKIYKSKVGEYKIINVFSKNRHKMCLIEFVETKYKTTTRKENALKGKVKNPYFPSHSGVGYMGDISSTKNERLYNVWRTMIARCYNPNNCEFKRYGEKGVIVCERWHCYKNFYEDAQKLNGYQLFLNNDIKKNVHLDKDVLSKGISIYSPDTCCWIKAEENERERWKKEILSNNKSKKYMGVSKTKNGRFHARISVNGKRIEIGIFTNEIAAANAYNYYAKENNTSFLNDCPFMEKKEWEKYLSKRRKKYERI